MKRKQYTMTYQGRRYEYSFRYVFGHGGYRAYIESMPSYGCRETMLTATHRLTDGDEYYICWSARVATEAEMDAVVKLWCSATTMYIARGGDSIDQYVKMIRQAEESDRRNVKNFRVEYGGKRYEFVFRYAYDAINGYRAFIESMPDYGGRPDSLAVTHRLREGNRCYVCWSNRIGSEKELDAVVSLWSRATVMYIVSGGTVDAHAATLTQAS